MARVDDPEVIRNWGKTRLAVIEEYMNNPTDCGRSFAWGAIEALYEWFESGGYTGRQPKPSADSGWKQVFGETCMGSLRSGTQPEVLPSLSTTPSDAF